VILVNDSSSDNWVGEDTMLLANNGGPPLAGIIIGASNYWRDLNANVPGWSKMVNAARSSGLENIPDITVSAGTPLTAPSDGQIDSTVPNHSAGAQRIIDLSRDLSDPSQPVVVPRGNAAHRRRRRVSGDPTVVDRVVVIAALGFAKVAKSADDGPERRPRSMGRLDRRAPIPVRSRSAPFTIKPPT
jgi:hypothetical protein